VQLGSDVDYSDGAIVVLLRIQERREKRIIYAALGGSVLASLVWLIALCTDGWVELILSEPGVYLPSLQYDAGGQVVLVEKMWMGIWHLCRVEYSNVTGHAANITTSIDTERPDPFEGIYTVMQNRIQITPTQLGQHL